MENGAYRDDDSFHETSFHDETPAKKEQNYAFRGESNVELRWDNVTVTAGKGETEKQILKNVSGRVRQGSVMAIMGSSGAGKSTLMNILTRRNIQGLKIDGKITVNGVDVKEDISKLSGYIQQNDVFVGALTVE